MPKTNPSVTSCSTNCHQMKSSSPCPQRGEREPAGSAGPSLSPDSRLREWRTTRGTRGFVTTLDESTGSVGDSSAPSRKRSVQLRSMTGASSAATITARDRHRDDELAQRQAPFAAGASRPRPRARRGTGSRPGRRSRGRRRSRSPGRCASTLGAPSPSRKPISTNSAGQREERATSQARSRAPPISSAPRRAAATSKMLAAGGENGHSVVRCQTACGITVLGKSPRWQDVDGACSGYLVEEDGFGCCSTAATACSPSCARFVDYLDVDAVVICHLHADHFLDLVPCAYALTYAPRRRGPRPSCTRRRARSVLPPGRRRVGQRRPDRDRVRRARVRPGRDAARRAADRPLPARAALRARPTPSSSSGGGGRFTFGADSRRRRAVQVRPGTDLLLIEATLPRPSGGDARAPHAGGGGRARGEAAGARGS